MLPLIYPFILLERFIFFECPDRVWDDSIWLYRILLWHDNLHLWFEQEIDEWLSLEEKE